MMFADYHIHTYYSDDSTYPMEQVVKDAISKGITDLCFTDHVDYGIKEDADKLTPEQRQELKVKIQNPNVPQYNVDYPAYVAEYQALKEKYADKINLKLGMEFGLQIHTIPQYQKLFNSYPFDFIIMSCHQVENKEFWTQEFQQGRSQDEYNQRYYDEILAQVKNYHDYSVLGHLDLIARYDKAGVYPFAKIRDKIAEILKIVIADGKGIELNTSSIRYKIHNAKGEPELTPSREILALYKELGGRIITTGSDSHKPEHLGAYIAEQSQELKKLGFKEICTFEKMQPIFHKL